MTEFESSHIYFALDSDVLRFLNEYVLYKEGKLTKNQVNSSMHKYFNEIEKLMDMVNNDKVRFEITNTIFQESKHSDSLLSFMKKYCYFPNINFVNHIEYAEKARLLAYKYSRPYILDGIECPAPIQSTYNADSGKTTPTNDAYAVGEATVEGAYFLTGNLQHIISNNRKYDSKNKDRAKGIIAINIQEKFGFYEANGQIVFTPKPVSFWDLCSILRTQSDNLLFNAISDDTKIGANEVLF